VVNRSINCARSRKKESWPLFHFPTRISTICTCPEATAGMTASALFCCSRCVRYPRPCITLLLLDPTHYECLVLTSNHMSSFFSTCSKQTIPSDITWPLTGLELVYVVVPSTLVYRKHASTTERSQGIPSHTSGLSPDPEYVWAGTIDFGLLQTCRYQ
jgi:hypothetical protein